MAMLFPKREVKRDDARHEFKLFKGVNRLKHQHQFLFAVVVAIGIISFWHGMTTMLDSVFLATTREIGALILILFGLLILLSSHYFTRVFMGEE